MTDTAYKIALEQKWREKFPSTLSGLFSFYQCLCTIAIIGCEIGSILIDLYNATIYVGFWASLFFMIAWISQAAAVSCRRTRKCAKYTLIIQCITSFFAVCVIGFDAYFIIYPAACFFPSTLCNSTVPIRGVFYSNDNFNNIKIPLIKGQLATATIMFAFCIDYVIMYVVTRIRIKDGKQSIVKNSNEGLPPPTNGAIDTVRTSPADMSVINIKENTMNVSSIANTDRNTSASIGGISEPSFIKFARHSRWSLDSNDINPIKI